MQYRMFYVSGHTKPVAWADMEGYHVNPTHKTTAFVAEGANKSLQDLQASANGNDNIVVNEEEDRIRIDAKGKAELQAFLEENGMRLVGPE